MNAQVESHIYRPAALLHQYVECLWYRRGDIPNRRREFSMPTAGADVVINLLEDRIRVFQNPRDQEGVKTSGLVVHGPQMHSFVIDDLKRVHFIGIHFKPGGSVLLGIPAVEILNQHLPLQDLWGSYASALRERLMECSTVRERFMLLEQELLRRLNDRRIVKPVVAFALRALSKSDSLQRVADVQRISGYGERRFTDLFQQTVGLSPKRFVRVRRLTSTLHDLARGWPAPLAQVAAANGFFDQAHLANEFRELVGIAPSQYRPSARSPLHMECDSEVMK